MSALYHAGIGFARDLLTIGFHKYIVRAMTEPDERMQQEDDEQKLARCVELYELAEKGGPFHTRDLADLQYFLGIKVAKAAQKTTWRLT